MKVCILSMQKIPNFGSLLQSYSLKKMLESLGHDVSFIDIEKIDDDYALMADKSRSFSDESEKQKKSVVLNKLSRIDKYFVNRIRIKKRALKQRYEFEKFRNDCLNIKDSDNYKNYDVCVIGSDEVFNCLAQAPWGFTSQLFGNVKQAEKVITYAASCGSTTVSEVPKNVQNKIRNTFKRVSAFSVRDDNTADFVHALSDKEVIKSLDPVVVGNFDKEIQKTTVSCELPKRYAVIYAYYNRIHKSEEIRAIKSFCKNHDLEMVTVGAPQMWIKKHLVLSPFEMLKVFKQADFVITDTFHGTIFSAKYADKFAVIARESNKNKLLDLIDRLGVDQHLLSSMNDLEKAYVSKNDINKVNAYAQKEREKTLEYLKQNI